jgi:hypothetical protein
LRVRYIVTLPKALVAIYDKKEVSILTSEKAGWAESPSLWSNNPSLVALSQNYFDTLWDKASENNHKSTTNGNSSPKTP